MPNPAFLKVMGISIHEYNSYGPKKKARFQQEAQQKLAELQGDPEAYSEFTDELESTPTLQEDEQ